MIKTLTLFAILFICLAANAQIKKGTVLIGGQISAGTFERNINYPIFPTSPPTPNFENDNFRFLIVGVSVGKAIKDNQVIGFNFNTVNFKQTYFFNANQSTVAKNNLNEAGIFYRKYKKLGKDIYLFGQANASVNFGKTTYSYANLMDNSTVKQSGILLSFSPGLAYALSKKFHIELSIQNLIAIQYNSLKQQFSNPLYQTYRSNSYGINTSLSSGSLGNVGLGFRLIL